MNAKRFVLAGGVSLVIVAAAAIGAAPQGTGVASSAQPRFVNAHVEARPSGPGFERAFAAAVAGQQAPAWMGYSVPAVPGDRHMCESDRYPSRAYLEGRPAADRDAGPLHAALEEPRDIAILFRVESGRVGKLRVYSVDCELDAGGLPVVWLTGVAPADSVALLRGMVGRPDGEGGVRQDSVLMAIALHRDEAAEQAIEAFAGPGQPSTTRKRAAFWLGAARGDRGFEALRRIIGDERDPGTRREFVFPVSLSHRADAVDLLIRLAREDDSAEVRKQAMFWLGQKAGQRAAAALASATEYDPDTDVKKRAVFGLSRMPNGEGVPRLIEVARANKNPEVRKQAVFWLAQSNDPRALAYLVELVKAR
jgi:hypothetical protein